MPKFFEEVREARALARQMVAQGFEVGHAARLLAPGFFINIYANARNVFAQYFDEEGKEKRVKLA